jgi:hypothetical protein
VDTRTVDTGRTEKETQRKNTAPADGRTASAKRLASDPRVTDVAASLGHDLGSPERGSFWEDVSRQSEELKNRPWSESVRGRLATRLISRGLIGAAFYSLMQIKAVKDMKDYNPDKSFKDIWHPQNRDGSPKKRKYLQVLAWLGDHSIGKLIEKTVNAFGHDGKAAVTFRDTRVYYRDANGKPLQYGRSLFHEAIGVSGDFYVMSIGDGLGRDNIVPFFDKNAKKSWLKEKEIKDENGNVIRKERKVDVGAAIKAAAHSVWRLTTYNGGEDIAVTIPYLYYMKGERALINHFSPGFKYDSDHALNGGSYKVRFNKDGKIRLAGDYQAEGALDLMGRFSAYNVGTLMFREAYNGIAHKLTRWWKHEESPAFTLPDSPHNALEQTFGGLYRAARYVVRSTVKAYSYMIPASFVFAVLRSSQSKDIGLAIHQGVDEHGQTYSDGPLLFRDEKGVANYIQANGNNSAGQIVRSKSFYANVKPEEWDFENVRTPSPPDKVRPLYFQEQSRGLENLSVEERKRRAVPNNVFRYEYNDRNRSWDKRAYEHVYIKEEGKPITAKSRVYQLMTNGLGMISKLYGDMLKPAMDWIGSVSSHKEGCEQVVNGNGRPVFHPDRKEPWHDNGAPFTKRDEKVHAMRNFSRRYTKAAIAYTAYFFVKSDVLSRKWDTPRADLALDRTIDGLFSFNFGEVKAGLKEYGRALRNKPFEDPDREALARRAAREDKVAGDGTQLSTESLNNLANTVNGYDYVSRNGNRAWTERDDIAQRRQQSVPESHVLAEQQRRSKEQNAPSTPVIQ